MIARVSVGLFLFNAFAFQALRASKPPYGETETALRFAKGMTDPLPRRELKKRKKTGMMMKMKNSGKKRSMDMGDMGMKRCSPHAQAFLT